MRTSRSHIFAGCDLGYTWFSENPSIATVDPDGTVRAVGVGRTRIFAAAALDELNLASTVVTVSVPASLQHAPSLALDLQVGDAAPAAVKLLDVEGGNTCCLVSCFFFHCYILLCLLFPLDLEVGDAAPAAAVKSLDAEGAKFCSLVCLSFVAPPCAAELSELSVILACLTGRVLVESWVFPIDHRCLTDGACLR